MSPCRLLARISQQVHLLTSVDREMLPHAKSVILHCTLCVITCRQQASGDVESTLLHRLQLPVISTCMYGVAQTPLVDLLTTYYTKKTHRHKTTA